MKFQHQILAQGQWQKLSLMEQLGNIGSEVSRLRRWQAKDKKIFENTVQRALELFILTIEDPRWREQLKEIARAKEILCDAILGGKEYGSSLDNLEEYFLQFALVARNKSYAPSLEG